MNHRQTGQRFALPLWTWTVLLITVFFIGWGLVTVALWRWWVGAILVGVFCGLSIAALIRLSYKDNEGWRRLRDWYEHGRFIFFLLEPKKVLPWVVLVFEILVTAIIMIVQSHGTGAASPWPMRIFWALLGLAAIRALALPLLSAGAFLFYLFRGVFGGTGGLSFRSFVLVVLMFLTIGAIVVSVGWLYYDRQWGKSIDATVYETVNPAINSSLVQRYAVKPVMNTFGFVFNLVFPTEHPAEVGSTVPSGPPRGDGRYPNAYKPDSVWRSAKGDTVWVRCPASTGQYWTWIRPDLTRERWRVTIVDSLYTRTKAEKLRQSPDDTVWVASALGLRKNGHLFRPADMRGANVFLQEDYIRVDLPEGAGLVRHGNREPVYIGNGVTLHQKKPWWLFFAQSTQDELLVLLNVPQTYKADLALNGTVTYRFVRAS